MSLVTNPRTLSPVVEGFRISERIVLSMVLCLCLSVILQMLGVPVTLLNPTLSLDIQGSSILEGFSIPPSPILLTAPTPPHAVSHPLLFPHLLLLTNVPFHPPL
ncbi:MAG TPA: hypothetical protein VIU63_02075 [Nitrospira sp.]